MDQALYKHYLLFSIFVNGTLGFFNSSRIVRQGNPLSPFLFAITMDTLSQMLEASIERGSLSGFSVRSTNNGFINVSHLLFAYDTLLFCDLDPGYI